MSILFNPSLVRFFLYQLYGYAFLDVHSSRFQCPIRNLQMQRCQKKSPSFQWLQSTGFMNFSRAENIYINTCDTSSNTTFVGADFPTSKLRAIPLAKAVFTAGSGANVAALRTRSRSLPMNNRRLNFYPVNIIDVLDLLVGSFFSGGFQCKTSIPKRGVPTGGKLGITSDRLVMITKEYLHAIIISPVWSVLSWVIFAPEIYWCMYFDHVLLEHTQL